MILDVPESFKRSHRNLQNTADRASIIVIAAQETIILLQLQVAPVQPLLPVIPLYSVASTRKMALVATLPLLHVQVLALVPLVLKAQPNRSLELQTGKASLLLLPGLTTLQLL